MNEHHEEMVGEDLESANVVVGSLREVVQDCLLEAPLVGIRSKRGGVVARCLETRADRERLRVLALDRVRDVRVDGFAELAPHDVAAHDVRDRSDRAEPLHAKEIRKSAEDAELAGNRFCARFDVYTRKRNVPQDEGESVPEKVANFELAIRPERLEKLDVLQAERLDEVR